MFRNTPEISVDNSSHQTEKSVQLLTQKSLHNFSADPNTYNPSWGFAVVGANGNI